MHLVWLVLSAACAHAHACYWNRECPYSLHATKTPYASVRGDIRDFAVPLNCKAVSLWTFNRHGNSNPKKVETERMKEIAMLKDEIIASHEAGEGQVCAQDITNLRKWTWNSTLEVSHTFLTGTGYEELYDIGSRIREKYRHLLQGGKRDYYFRPTHEQRTITSAIAFVHGLSDGTNLSLSVEDAWEKDDVTNSFENCNRHQQTVMKSKMLDHQLDAFDKTEEFIIVSDMYKVQQAVQSRLGIATQLSPTDIFSLYQLCRFDRSWSEIHQSPWCAAFSNSDLMLLEYRDDVRQYYMFGYGSWVNPKLGGPALKDLFENFSSAVQGQGRKITSYFTRTTSIEMLWSALGIFKDNQLESTFRNTSRAWRTSYIAPFSSNLIAVLNSCQESGNRTHRVQFFINEKETEICPLKGCTWEKFQNKFQGFAKANLDFCSLD